jgi:hypothetical protein
VDRAEEPHGNRVLDSTFTCASSATWLSSISLGAAWRPPARHRPFERIHFGPEPRDLGAQRRQFAREVRLLILAAAGWTAATVPPIKIVITSADVRRVLMVSIIDRGLSSSWQRRYGT